MMKPFALAVSLTALTMSLCAARTPRVNYDETKVFPYEIADPLTFADGTKVKSADDWRKRRMEILDIFAKNMYGAEPPKPEAVVTECFESGLTLGELAVREQIRMWFKKDRTGPYIDWLIVRPRHATGPVPVVLRLNYYGNHEFLSDPEVLPPHGWVDGRGTKDRKSDGSTRGYLRNTQCRTPHPADEILARGYAFMTACYGDISPDPDWKKDDMEKLPYTGVFGLWGERDEKRTDNPGALGAWAWAMSRALDYIETDSALDAKRVVATGCSRLGKAALLAAARDERFAVCVPNQTGKGGVPLTKRFFGENVDRMIEMFPFWFCKEFRKYVDNESSMPFDQHMLLACVAPRALLVQGFNRPWFDPKGEYLSCKAASCVWEFLGRPGMPGDGEEPADFSTEAVGPYLGYVRRPGLHGISGYDWKWMLDFADRAFADMDLPKTVHLVPAPRKLAQFPGVFRTGAKSLDGLRVKETEDKSLGLEAYRLKVTASGVEIRSGGAAGAFYARRTLKQLAFEDGGSISLPCVEIEDSPAFGWRGIMLDVARHFFDVAEVKRFIDLMADHKLNVLHWHLMDNQGWRIEIDRYPELAKIASVREYSKKHKHLLDTVPEGTKGFYGPYCFTKAEIRDVIGYAAKRHVRVIPEVEIPGHSRAALRAFPELMCFADDPSAKPTNAVNNVYCAGNDKVLAFLENILDEVCELFPDPVVHIGGDEVKKHNWVACAKCKKRMQEVGAKTPEELQAWMNGHFAKYLAKKGKRPIWWGEIPDMPMPKELAVMSWLGPECGVEAAKRGHEVVMCPHKSLYFDYTPCIPFDFCKYPWFTEKLPVSKVYEFDPLEGIPPEYHRYVLGGQACCWTEYTCTVHDLDWKTWTRAAAMSEVFWTAPKVRDGKEFLPRLRSHVRRLRKAGVNCSPVDP